jgi:nitrous oxidase accessory protein NosD
VGLTGCAAIFVDPDGVCRPAVEKCASEPGTIPKFDEGCIPVGIEGCAPEFIEADGLCHPSMEKCAAQPGTFAVPQLGCASIDGPLGCGAGAWGNIPDGPDTVYVDASYAGGSSDGTQAQPWTTIAQAMAAVPSGGTIALAAGTYTGSTTITKSVTLAGRCPSMVHLDSAGGAGTVYINAASNVTIRGVRVSGASYGIRISSAAGATIEGVHIVSAHNAGVVVRGATSKVTLSASLIEATLPNVNNLDAGYGIDIADGGDIAVSDSAIFKNHERGVLVSDAGTHMDLTNTLIEGTLPSAADQENGYGIYVNDGASAKLVANAIVANRKGGAAFEKAGTAGEVIGNIIERTAPQESTGKLGVGLDADGGAFVTATRNAIVHNHSGGVRGIGPGTILQTTQNWVAFTEPSMTDRSGVGFEIQEGAQAYLVGDVIYQNHVVGMFGFKASSIQATGLVVQGTQPLPGSNQDGAGALMLLGTAPAVFKSCAVIDNFVSGIAFGWTSGFIQDSLISSIKAGSFEDDVGMIHTDFGDGVAVAFMAVVSVERTIAEHIERAGILFDQSSGLIGSCESRENGFGVVIQRMPRPDFDPEQSSVHTNTVKNYVSDGELSIPSAFP